MKKPITESNINFLRGGGEMGALTRKYDWASSQLGPPDQWQQSLRTTVSILLSSKFPMLLWWGDDLIQFYNDAYRPSLGNEGKHPSALGQKGIDCWPEIWPTIYPLINQVRTTGEATWSEDQLIPIYRNGKLEDVYWTFSYSPVMGENGNIDGILVVCNETTEKVLSANRMRNSEQHFQNLIREATVGIIVLEGENYTIAIVNETYAKLIGRNTTELLGKSLFDIIPEATDPFREIHDRVRNTGESVYLYGEPYSVKNKNGESLEGFLNLIFQPYKEADGTITGTMTLCQDVTEQIQMRLRTEESEQRFRSLVESAPFPIGVYLGKDLIITLANEAILNIWGRDRSIIGKKYKEALPELSGQNIFEELEKVYATGEAHHVTNRYVELMIDGKMHPYYMNYSFKPLQNSDGKVYGILSTAANVTDLNIAKRKAEESEAKFRSLIEEAPVATCLFVGKDMTVEVANEMMLNYWGKNSSVIGKPLIEGVPELLGQPFINILNEVYTTGKTYEAKNALAQLEINGSLQDFYFDFTYKPLFNSEGKVYAIMDMALDVTEKVMAERLIIENQRLLLASFEQSPVGIALLSADNLTFLTANPFYGNLVGRKPEDIIGKPLIEALPEIKGQGFDLLLYEVISTGIPYTAKEVKVKIQYGENLETIYVDLAYQPKFEQDGTISAILVVAIDVTQQLISRRKIEESEASLQGAVEMAELAMWSLNIKNKTFSYSPRFMEWLGLTEDSKTIDEAYDSLPEEYRSAVADAIADSITIGSPGFYKNEHPVINRITGQKRIIQAHAYVFYDSFGNPETLSGTAQDITKERELQQQLEFLVARRTEQLQQANRGLEEANNNLQRSNAELAQFAYIASHDLQEPARKISTFIKMLENNLGKIDERSKNYINRINNSSERMITLIRDILMYSQLSKENRLFVPVNLTEIIQEILSDFELIIEQKQVKIQLENLPVLEAIPLQMVQLFSNLISNSLKYSKENVIPEISLSATILLKEEYAEYGIPDSDISFFKIVFTDNGIGFNQEYAEQIFNIFQRLHGKMDYAGTGIGLSICKKIAENHNGYIFAEGEEGVGAKFTVILPSKQNQRL